MPKRSFPLKISFDHEIDRDTMFFLAVKFAREYPKAATQIIGALEGERKYCKINCPFPFVCSEFPCKTLCCNADCCDNGHAYRMS